jgi:hypothetical protein
MGWKNWLRRKQLPYELVAIEHINDNILIILRQKGVLHKKTLQQLIVDDAIIEGLPSKTVRSITYLATLEKLSPDCQIIALKQDAILKDYQVTLKDKKDAIESLSASSISKNKAIINKLSSADAHRIGYLAGLNEALIDT